MEKHFEEFDSDILSIQQEEIKEPKKYQVILFNDDFTTKDFVVEILEKFFHKSLEESVIIMETVHQKGSAVVGEYTYDIALTRVKIVIKCARANGFPLRCELKEISE